jgi:hypothetical protein
MIELGPLAELIPKTGEEFIRLPGGGRIDAVTSAAISRLGQRVTFVPQDETGLWTASNGGHNLAKKQRQGLAGMSGRAMETTNAWNPADDSVAQRTFESSAKDINRDFRQPPEDLDFKDKKQRRKIFLFNYAGAPWVDIDSVEGQAFEMLEKDAADAERFFGNRIVSGSGHWMARPEWAARMADGKDGRREPITVAPRTKVCLGFDGSDNDDYTGIRLETLDFHQFTPRYGQALLPTVWKPQDWGGRIPRREVMAAFRDIANQFQLVRGYADPEMWETEIDELAAELGEKRLIKWGTNRITVMHASLERFRVDVTSEDSRFTTDDDPETVSAIGNAVVRARGLDKLTKRRVYILGKPTEHQKIDLAMSSVLAHEAVCDAIAAGANAEDPESYVYY